MSKVTCIVGPSAVTPQQEAHAESPHEGTISGLGIWQPLTHQVWGTFPGCTHGSDFQHSRYSWPCVSNTQQISLCSPFHSLGSFSPSLLWKLLDPISPETPYESLPDVFQMLGLGTRSEISKSWSLPWECVVSATQSEKEEHPAGVLIDCGVGWAMAKTGGPDNLNTEHQNLPVTEGLI